MLSPDEMANVEVIGTVKTKFLSFQFLHYYNNETMAIRVYAELMRTAQKKFDVGVIDNKIDVVNIKAVGKFSPLEIPLIYPFMMVGNAQTIHATGDVIVPKDRVTIVYIQPDKTKTPKTTNAPPIKNTPKGLEDAIKRVISSLMNGLPGGSKIAVVNVESDDKNTVSLVIDEVEFHLVSTKRFTIVDRSTLDLIIKEQKFQMSGAVNDNDVVQIGALSGANVVIAGSVIKSENTNRLSLKALDVKTGQIITMAHESY
jgi:hypothetical protein